MVELCLCGLGGGYGLRKLLVMGLLEAWPTVPALGLLWRWSLGVPRRGARHLLAITLLVVLSSNESQSGRFSDGCSVVRWCRCSLLSLASSGRDRGVAFPLPRRSGPRLRCWPLEWLAVRVDTPPESLLVVVETIGALPRSHLHAVALAGRDLAGGGLLARWLAGRYRASLSRARLSVRGVVLAGGADRPGLAGDPFRNRPRAFAKGHKPGYGCRWVSCSPAAGSGLGGPPTLLVLRVFRRDAEVASLFDAVIERWRQSGNTVMIAGTDLVTHTVDPDDIFTFLSRRLGERFIASPADVAARIAGFDLVADPDGRYR